MSLAGNCLGVEMIHWPRFCVSMELNLHQKCTKTLHVTVMLYRVSIDGQLPEVGSNPEGLWDIIV